MKLERLPPVRTSLSPTNHPYMTGAWTPQHEEVNAWDLEVLEGAIPADLDGVYLRNTENLARVAVVHSQASQALAKAAYDAAQNG